MGKIELDDLLDLIEDLELNEHQQIGTLLAEVDARDAGEDVDTADEED